MSGPVHRPHGFTLVEVLLAVAIAIVLMGLCYAIYHTVATTAVSQQQRHSRRAVPVTAADQLTEDVEQAFLPEDDETCSLVVTQGDGNDLDTLALCTMVLSPDHSDPAWAVPNRVEYRVAAVSGDAHSLLRVHRPLAGPGSPAPATNTLLSGVTGFHVAAYDGASWSETWPPEEGEEGGALPKAIRVAVESESIAEPIHLEIFVPASHTAGEASPSP
jgi:type II secretion system protein J